MTAEHQEVNIRRSAEDDDEEINVVDVSDDEKPSHSGVNGCVAKQPVSVIRHVHIDPTHQPVITVGQQRPSAPADGPDGLMRTHRASLPPNWQSSSKDYSSGSETPLDLRVKSGDRTQLRRNKSFNSAKRTATTDVFTDQSPSALNKSCDADTLRKLGIKRAPMVYPSVSSATGQPFSLAPEQILNFATSIIPPPSQQDLLMQRWLSSSANNLELLRLYRTVQSASPIPKSLQQQTQKEKVAISHTDSGNDAEACLDVDEHFKKSLSQKRQESTNADVDAHFEKALGDTWRKLKDLTPVEK